MDNEAERCQTNDSPTEPLHMRKLRNCLPEFSAAAAMFVSTEPLTELVFPDPEEARISHEMTPLIAAVLDKRYELVEALKKYKFTLSAFTYNGYRIENATAYTAALFFNEEVISELADEAGPPLYYEKLQFPLRQRQPIFACEMGGVGDEEYYAILMNAPLLVFTDETDFTGATLLMRASEWGSSLSTISKLGFEAGRRASDGTTAMQRAIESDNMTAVEFLTEFDSEILSAPNGYRLVEVRATGL